MACKEILPQRTVREGKPPIPALRNFWHESPGFGSYASHGDGGPRDLGLRTTSTERTNTAGDRRGVPVKIGRRRNIYPWGPLGTMAHQGDPWMGPALQTYRREKGSRHSDPRISSSRKKEWLLRRVPHHGYYAACTESPNQARACSGAGRRKGLPITQRFGLRPSCDRSSFAKLIAERLCARSSAG